MKTIVAILRAAHCKSTHHFFAIDSLWEVSSPRGMELADFLLANYGDYLKGAKAPDTVFKDFENHVIHVADGYWGGAAKAGKKWLDQTYRLLSSGRWNEAAYAIGVLSHYFTDPFMPLHTAQSPREAVIHRPLEWSVCCAYQDIYQRACLNAELKEFELPSGSEWMVDAIHQGANFAHRYYEALLDDYNMSEAGRFPKLALGTESKQILAQLFVSVHTAWGSVLDRIAEETTSTLPKASLTLPTLLAGLQLPKKKIVQTIESTEQRKEVESILDEYWKTGKVVRNISIEQRQVQVVRKRNPNLRPAPTEMERIAIKVSSSTANTETRTSAKAMAKLPAITSATLETENVSPAVSSPDRELQVPPKPPAAIRKMENDEAAIPQAVPSASDRVTSESVPKSTRQRLTLGSPIVDAPAIGPKTAARFHAIGCNTIDDFLSRDAQQIADLLDAKWISARLVVQWQDQARMACQIERLTAVGSGLLIIAGIRSARELAQQNGLELHARLVEAAGTSEGTRLLREQDPPSLKAIERWITAAEYARSA